MPWGGGGNVSIPDSRAEEAELRRQTDALIAQFQAAAAAQQEMFNQQRAADEQRYSQTRAGDLAEAERQRAILTQQLTDQRASQEEINARLAQQQQEAEAQAAKRATDARMYSEGRSNLIDQVSGALDTAYGGFDDNFFDTYATRVLNSTRGVVDREFADDRRTTRLALADNSNLNSSAAARALGLVKEKYNAALGQRANEASDAATRLRGEIDGQKSQALSSLVSSAFVGDENLPDGVTDVNGMLGTITQRLNNYVQGVTENVRTYAPMGGAGAIQMPQITTPQITTPNMFNTGI